MATKAKATKGKAVAKKKSAEVASLDVYEEDSGLGFEGVGKDDLLIPFIVLAQALTPAAQEDEDAYLEGLKPGMFFNNVTDEIYESLRFVPVHRKHEYLEWVPRDQGGGFGGAHDPQSELILKLREETTFGGLTHPETDNDLVETFSVYGLLLSEDDTEWSPAVMSFSKTGLRGYKQWMTKATGVTIRGSSGKRITPPLFAHRYTISSQRRKNDKGAWYVGHAAFADGNAEDSRIEGGSPLYEAGKSFRDMAKEGSKIKVNRENTDEDGGDSEGGDTF